LHRCKNERSVIDLNQMILFARVVSCGSFTAAARDLRVPPSTVSRKVAALEERLGVRLLQRSTRRLQPTDAGSLYYQSCLEVQRRAQAADALVDDLARNPQGTLRLSAPPSLGDHFLAAPLAEYRRRFPSVSVEVVLTDRVVDLVAERFDVVIRAAQNHVSSTLVMRRLVTLDSALCASAKYADSHGLPVDFRDLGRHATLALGPGGSQPSWTFLGASGAATEVPLHAAVLCNSPVLLRDLCLAGAGIALLPAYLAKPALAARSLVEVLPRSRPRPTRIALLQPSAGRSTKVRAFIDLLEDHLARGGRSAPPTRRRSRR
jgi:DNA-binding transcriptional LysR family regulator